MTLAEIDYVDGLNLLYKPNSVAHKALLLATADGASRMSIMPFTSFVIAPRRPVGWSFSVYIFTKHFSHSLVEQTGQFTVNVPPEEMEEIVKYCGSVSGRDHDKFSECHLTKKASRYVTPPLIGECLVQIECQVQGTRPFTMTFPGQDKKELAMTIFEADIVAMHAQEDAGLRPVHSE